MQFCGTCSFSISRLYYVTLLLHFRGNFTVLHDVTAITTDYFADEDFSVRANDHVLNHAHCSHVVFFIAAAKKLLKTSVHYGYLSSTRLQTDKVSDKLVNTVELKSPVLCSGVSGDDQQF